jgi:tetratricopeptide (TPR) repeat protein
MDSQELAVFEGLGRIWWHRKDKKSIYYYQKGLDIAQTPRQKSEFLEYLGNAYMRMGQTQKAIKSYQEALKLKPVSKFSLFNNLAFAYQKINKSKEACSYAKRALRLLRKRTKEYRKTKAAQAFEKQLKELIKNRPSY